MDKCGNVVNVHVGTVESECACENVALTYPSSHAHFGVLSFHSVPGDALLLLHCNLDTSQSSRNQQGSIGKS